ncbi:LysE family translocator [Parendozoicomonas haliclonae]|uniref:Homoserine/homoserine lactone efflux protein n=1 Tax=Parendozoicomonas haliclonae TaxID=1960125 RepID=A0A1X7AKN7_9GAMM|nr:LysE family translocator [Parendozoicomonas haliclonae]SMA48221.1 Homoserine/homoserine lactone efflux protein [Parendozoicomonas haliclonae]
MPIELWPAIIALILLSLAPGADTLIVMRNTSRGGLADGLITSLGICSALFMHALVSAAGVSVILLQSASLFSLLKLAGAAYLIWLGIGSLKQIRKSGQSLSASDTQPLTFSALRSFREGFLSNALNPKTVVFYMAFLPQFIDPAGNAISQSLTLAAIHFVIAMAWQSLIALMIHRARVWLTNPKVERVFHGLTGGLLVALGAGLIIHRA